MTKFAMASGRLIDIEHFTEDDVHLEDIAHNLAKIQRYNGAIPINVTYSVGEHCINLYRALKAKNYHTSILCWAILHDASEAYLSDIAGPIKHLFKSYCALEKQIMQIIYKRLIPEIYDNAWWQSTALLALDDKRIMLDEVETIMHDKFDVYQSQVPYFQKLGCDIQYNNHPTTVKQCFLTICAELGIE